MTNLKKIALLILAFASLMSSCKQKVMEEIVDNDLKIVAPIPGLEAAFQEFTIDASKDQKIELENGGVISIPAHSLTNEAGDLVEGLVKIKYREYHDAVDAFLSGIPMEYTADGTKETMQTAGMFEIRGEQAGQELSIAEASYIHVKMASYEATKDYSFFQLIEKDAKGWELLTDEYDIEVNEQKIKEQKQLEAQPKPMAFPLDAQYFTFDYYSILDVVFNDDYYKIRENKDNPAIVAKAKRYGMTWLNARVRMDIQFQGVKQPAAMMLWKRLNGQNYPQWLKDEQVDYCSLEKQYGNVYKLTIENRKTEEFYTATIQAIMPLKSLFKFSPKYWENNYQAAMAKVEAEMQRLKKEADVFRSMEISGFGIYNYDKFLKVEERVDIIAKFEVEETVKAQNELFDLDMVFCLPEDNKTLIKLPKEDWGKVALLPGNRARFMSVLPGGKIGIYSAEKYVALDFDGLKQQDQPQVEFVLIQELENISDAQSLKTALAM